MDQELELGTAKISKLLRRFAIPCIVSLVLNAVYNMVDQIFIGIGVGYTANAATNVIYPLMQFSIAASIMIGDGAATYLNLKLGEGDQKAAEKGVAAGIVGLLGVGVILCLVYNIFLEPLCWLFGATENTIDYALGYGRIISIGMVFGTFTSSQSIIRSDGSPKVAMIGMLAGFAVNMIGDPLAIFVLDAGVEGAAWATIIGQAVNSLINVIYLCRCKTVKLNKNSFKDCLKHLRKVSHLGLSSFTSQITAVVIMLVCNNLLVVFGEQSKYGGDIPLAALGVTMKVFSVLQCVVSGLMCGAQPIISYNYGNKKYDRIQQTLKITLVISLGLMAAATLVFQLSPMLIVRMFGNSSDLYNEFAVKCLRIYLMLLILDGFTLVSSFYLQFIGKAGKAAVLMCCRNLVVLIPCMYIFARLFGVEGILWAGTLTSFVIGIVSAIIFVRENRSLTLAQQAAQK